jgi:hypothetical protein
MIRHLAVTVAVAGAAVVVAGAACAQPLLWRPNPEGPPVTATTDISPDTTGSMQTSSNNPDWRFPAYDAQSGPRSFGNDHGYIGASYYYSDDDD